jgi:hypothetical protein
MLSTLYYARLDTANFFLLFPLENRDVLTFSGFLFLVLPAVSPVQEADRLRHSPPALQVLV